MKVRVRNWAVCLGLMALCACGGKDGGSSDNPSGEGDPIQEASKNLLSLSLPADLSIDSPFNGETLIAAAGAKTEFDGSKDQLHIPAGLRLKNEPIMPPNNAGDSPAGPAERRRQLGKILYAAKTIEECFYSEQRSMANTPNCYGPALAYNKHPDDTNKTDWGTDFEATGRTFIGGGDLGIWDAETESGEACIAATMNGAIGAISSKVNNAIGYVAMVTCIARVQDGKLLPKSGEELDLGEYLSKVSEIADNNFSATLKTFKMKNMSEEGADESTFETTMSYVVDDPMQPNQGTRKVQLTLSHTGSRSLSSAYNGYLKITESPETLDESLKCGQGEKADNKLATSVHYKKNSDGLITYESRSGGWLPSIADDDMFDSDSHAKTPAEGDCNLGGTFTVSALNSDSGLGKVAHAWIAGQGGELTRSFVASVGEEGNGDQKKKSGCGFFGFGPTMDDLIETRNKDLPSDRKLTFIDKFTCNWSQFNAGRNFDKDLVQKQCMSQNDEGVYTPDSNNITFSPQNNCAAGPGSDFELFQRINNVWTAITPAETTDLISISDTSGDDLKSPEIP